MKLKLQLLCLVLMTAFSFTLTAQNTVSGTITDANSGETLIGANIIIQGTSTGTTTDLAGNFTLSSSQDFPWNLSISYTGYTDQTIEVTNATSNLAIALASGITFQDEVVISASRKREKVTESVASVAVLSSARLASMAAEPSAESLIKNIAGVRVINNGVIKKNIFLRGAALANESATLVLKDYRPINSPYTNAIESQLSPISSLDIERVEVIKGPAGALWGPGVNQGVVHYISKDPFRHPGTSIGINRSVEGQGITKVDFRHAGSSDKFGYKLLFTHKSGDDFTFDLNDPIDIDNAKSTIASAGPPPGRDGIFDDLLGNQLPYGGDADGGYNLIPNFNSNVAELTLEYKLSDDAKIALVPSMGVAEINFRNANNHLRIHSAFFDTQLRLNVKDFFASVNYYHQPGYTGDVTKSFASWVGAYSTGAVDNFGEINGVDIATQLPVTVNENLDFVFGVDAKIVRYNGEYMDDRVTIASRNGRYEDDDDFNVIGGYAQATYRLSPKFKVNAVARVDNFTIYGTAFTPRVGFVFNPDDEKNHAIRGALNRSSRAPTVIRTMFDTRLGPRNVLGSRTVITFDQDYVNWAFDKNTNPSLQSIVNGLSGGLSEAAQAELANATVAGNASTNLTDPFLRVPLSSPDAARVEKSSLETATSFELGYSGTSDDKKLKFGIDAYYQVVKNMELSFSDVGPLVNFSNLGGELAAALPGVSQSTIDELVAAAPKNSRMVGDQHVDAGQRTARTAGFRSYSGTGAKFFGFDANLQYVTESGLSPFLNFSWINKVVFDTEDLGEAIETGRMYWLNTPPSRLRFGVNKIVTGDKGFYGNLTGRYDSGFFATQGGWRGDVDNYFLVDASVGYQFDNGLNVGVSSSNLTDVVYRSFPRIPAQRRLVFLNLTYTINHNTLSK